MRGRSLRILGLLWILVADHAPGLDEASVIGRVAGAEVRLSELEGRSLERIRKLWQSQLEVKRDALERLIQRRLLEADGASATLPAVLPTVDPAEVARFHASVRPTSIDASWAAELLAIETWRARLAARATQLAATAQVERFLPDSNTDPNTAPNTAPGTAQEGEPSFPEIVARSAPRVGREGWEIQDADLEAAAGLRLFQLRGQVVAEARRGFEGVADARLLAREARRRGMEPDALEAAVQAEAPPVTREAILEYYAARREKLDELHPERIRNYLEFRTAAQARQALLDQLRAADPPRFLLALPPEPRIPLPGEDAGAVAKGIHVGSGEAPITVVVFSNFRCRLCETTEEILDSLLAGELAGKLHLVRRQLFPRGAVAGYLDGLVSVCAARTGRYDEFRTALRRALKASQEVDPVGIARSIFPDASAFERCLSTPEARSAVVSDLDRAREIGFDEAPGFLIDGLPVVGFQGRQRLESWISDAFEQRTAVRHAVEDTADEAGPKEGTP